MARFRRWTKRSGKGLLSEAQQRRYMRKGLTQSEYRDKRTNLSAVRGHKATPEHGGTYEQHKERYPSYKHPINVIAWKDGHAQTVTLTGLTKRERSQVAQHRNAVLKFLDRESNENLGHHSLDSFEGKKVGGYAFVTSEDELEMLGDSEDLSFNELYPKVK
jgi:hypothetical protein